MIQHSETLMLKSRCCGVLDTPLESVIRLAGGQTRWWGMTSCHEAAPSIAIAVIALHPLARHDVVDKPVQIRAIDCGYSGYVR
jgi:hypothetical protein